MSIGQRSLRANRIKVPPFAGTALTGLSLRMTPADRAERLKQIDRIVVYAPEPAKDSRGC